MSYFLAMSMGIMTVEDRPLLRNIGAILTFSFCLFTVIMSVLLASSIEEN